MAYLVDYTVQQSTAGATSVAVTLPSHETNDILVVFWTQDATTTASMTGWTQIGTTQQPTGLSAAMFWKRAASSAETGTLTLGAADAYTIKAFCIRDVDTTTAVDVSSTTNSGATTASQFNSTSVTTTTSDCFVLYAASVDGIAVAVHSDPGVHFIQSSDSTGTTATTAAASGCAWYIQRSAGATPTPGWRCSLSGTRADFTVAFRNVSGGIIPAYIDDVSPPVALVAGHHFSTLNGISFPGALTLNNIGPAGTGKATTYDAAAATADYGINPYSAALASTPTTTALTGVKGFEVTFSPTINVTNKFIMGTAIASTPRQANFDLGPVNPSGVPGGIFMAFGSSGTNTNYRSYQVLASDSKPNPERRAVFSVNPNQTSTAYGTNGTFDATLMTKMLFLSNNPTAAITLYTCDWVAVEKVVVAGGSTTRPVDTAGVADIGKSARIPMIEQVGAAGLISYVPLQIGGSDAVNFAIDAGSLQFPRIYAPTTDEINFHADVNTFGISYAGKSGDVISHTNSVVACPSEYYWEINSAATNAASWDFTGLTVAGARVTLRNVMTFTSMVFAEFVALSANGCSLSQCTLSAPPATSGSLIANSTSSFDSCTIDTTTVAAGNSLIQTATPNIFTNCTFEGSASSGHTIEITATGTFTLSGNQFLNYGANASTSAAIYNNSGGAVTLNISGGNSPTVRNGTGASTNVVNTVDFSVTNIIDGTEIRIYRQSDMVELAGANTVGASPDSLNNLVVASDPNNAGRYKVTYSYNYTADTPVFVVAHSLSYQWLRTTAQLVSTNSSLQITQLFDRQYLNP